MMGEAWGSAMRISFWGITAFPALVLVIVVAVYGYDYVFWDEYEMVPLVAKAMDGELSLGELWASQNEHRLLFPYVIFIETAKLTRWRHGAHQAWTLLFALATFAVLARQLRQVAAAQGNSLPLLLLPWISLLLFSIVQWEVWLWGYHLFVYWQIMVVTVGFVLLARSENAWAFIAAIVLGFVASTSHGNGLLYWLVGAAALAVTGDSLKVRLIRLAVWLIASGAAFGVYFYGLELSPGESAEKYAFDPIAYAKYVCVYLGSPLANATTLVGFCATVLGLLLFAAIAMCTVRQPREQRRALLPFVCLAVYSIGCAAATGLGRAQFGSGQATSSRYSSFALMFWISLGVLVAAWAFQTSSRARLRAAALFFALTTAGSLASDGYAAYYFTQKHAVQQRAREQLFTFEDEALAARMYPRVDVLRERIETLKRYRLSMFR